MLTRRKAVGLSLGFAGTFAVPGSSRAADANTDANKEIAERYVAEVWDQGNLEVLDELVAEDFTPDNPEEAPGRVALRGRIRSARQGFRAAFDEVQYTIEDVIGEGDQVVVRGFITAKASAREFKALYFTLLTFEDGLIASESALVDNLALL
jgi:ketosteroid isomerase-like protein